MTSAYYYNQQQQQPGGMPQRGIPGQIGINPMQGQYIQQQQQQQQQQQAYRNQAINDTLRKRAHNKAIRQNTGVGEEIEEPSGDELDDISARDIAMARYKRNHDYLSEIFTPYNASSITPAALDFSQTKEELEKQIKEYTERSVRQKTEHDERLAALDKENESFWELMNDLNKADTIQSIDAASEKLTSELKVQLEHKTRNVRAVSIPGIQEDSAQEQQQQQQQQQPQIKSPEQPIKNVTENNMDLYFNDREEVMNDSFFNDMVNTDDDPSVSEFLNTE